MLFWTMGGVIGATIGAVIWIVIGMTTHYEVGYIAWGIGMVTGIGLRYAAYLKDIEESALQGIVAALLAAAAIVGAKYVVFRSIDPAPPTDTPAPAASPSPLRDILPESVAASRGQTEDEIPQLSFSDMFTPWDFLWFGLAVVTAYKIGEGSFEWDD